MTASTGPHDPSSKSEPRLPIDLTIEVTDRHGVAARLTLSSYSFLQPQIEDKIMKAGWMSSSMPSSEIVFQTFEFPLAEFVKVAPTFDTTSLATLRFIFDRTPAGVVVLDDIGIRRAEKLTRGKGYTKWHR